MVAEAGRSYGKMLYNQSFAKEHGTIGIREPLLLSKNVDFSFPVLILVGEKDSTGKVKAYCKKWAKQTGFPLHFIKQAKHFSNGDNPEQVNNEIQNFIIETVRQERENYAVL